MWGMAAMAAGSFFSDMLSKGGMEQADTQTGWQKRITKGFGRIAGRRSQRADKMDMLSGKGPFKPFGGAVLPTRPNPAMSNVFDRNKRMAARPGSQQRGPASGNPDMQAARGALEGPLGVADIVNKGNAGIMSKVLKVMNSGSGSAGSQA